MADSAKKKTGTAAAKKTGSKSKEPSIPQKTQKKQPSGTDKTVKTEKPAKKQAQPVKEAKEQRTVSKQKIAIILMAVALFLLAMAFIEGESVWLLCHNGLFGIFGTCAYLIPVLLIYLAVIYAKDSGIGSVAANLIEAGILIVLASSAIHIFSNPASYFTDTEILPQISKAWNVAFGVEKSGFFNGGVIGTALGGLMGRLFGKTGAAVTVVILNIVALLFLTGISLPLIASAVGKSAKLVSNATTDKIEKNTRRREERREQKEKEAEEKAADGDNSGNDAKSETAPVISGGTKKQPPVIQGKSSSYAPLDEPGMPEGGFTPTVTVNGKKLPAGVDGNPDGFEPAKPKEELVPTLEKHQAKKARRPVASKAEETDSENKPIETEKVKETEKEQEKKEKAAKVISFPPASDAAEKTYSKKYIYPSIECLNMPLNSSNTDSVEEMQQNARKLVETLESFRIRAEVVNICRGPSVTRFELVPEAGVRINKITTLSDDIALRLAAKSVRIEAPIPGKAAIGVEIPNGAGSMVSMREIIDTDQYRAGTLKSKLNVALGKDIAGNIITADLAKMPHLLVAGTTGSGKSVCMNSMIISILYNATPEEVRFLMIDPKKVEFTVYNGIAHLEVPVVTEARKAAAALGWAVSEMEKRYGQFSANGVRDIKGFNKLCDTRDDLVKMHHIVIFIDELSDLMMASPKEVEDSICRLAQMARAAGIHLVIATQRPSADVITGIIKANIPSRIALFVSSAVDSRTIIDSGGAEKLLGNGDMLFSPVGAPKPIRVQGCFISDEEVETVVNHIKEQTEATYNDETIKEIEEKFRASENASKGHGYDDDDEADALDPMFNDAAAVVVEAGQASTTMLQKKLKLGYARASRVMDQLEENGIVGPSQGAKPREILVSKQEWYERLALSGSAPVTGKQMSFDDMEQSREPQPQNFDYEEAEPEEEELPFDEDEEAGITGEEEPKEAIFDFLEDEEDEDEDRPEYVMLPADETDYDENCDGDFYDYSAESDYTDEDDEESIAPVNIDDIFSDDGDYAGSDD